MQSFATQKFESWIKSGGSTQQSETPGSEPTPIKKKEESTVQPKKIWRKRIIQQQKELDNPSMDWKKMRIYHSLIVDISICNFWRDDQKINK